MLQNIENDIMQNSKYDESAGGEFNYHNPVFEPILADPSIIHTEVFFYVYSTEDNWGNFMAYKRSHFQTMSRGLKEIRD